MSAQLAIAVLGGLIAIGLAGWYCWRQLRYLRAPRSATTFVGGVRFHAIGGGLSGARTNLTAPFAELELDESRLELRLTDAGWRLSRGFAEPPPRVTFVAYSDIETIDRFQPGGFRVRLYERGDPRDGLVFWARRRDRTTLATTLNRRLGREVL